MPPPQLLVLPINLMTLHSYSMTPYLTPMASPPSLIPVRTPVGSWVVLVPCSIKCTSLLPPSQLWLILLAFSTTTTKHRALRLQLGLISYPAYPICILHFNNDFQTSPILCHSANMWRRSRAPCSCPTCVSEELREQFRSLRVDVRCGRANRL
jgi:hypothetical protein